MLCLNEPGSLNYGEDSKPIYIRSFDTDKTERRWRISFLKACFFYDAFLLSSTCLTIADRSLSDSGFIANPLMPSSLAFSSDMVEL